MKTIIVKNWKTTSAGVLVALAFFLKAKGFIDKTTFELIFGIGSAFGLVFAKDASK